MSTIKTFDFQTEDLVKDRKSLRYDAKALGYDAGFWKTLTGTPAASANGFSVTSAGAEAYQSCHYGTYIFRVVIQAPGVWHNKIWGLGTAGLIGAEFIGFRVSGSVFSIVANDGTNFSEKVITFNPTWAGESGAEFKIYWDPDFAKFFVNDVFIGEFALGRGLPTDEVVPQKPLSPLLKELNGDSFDLVYLILMGVTAQNMGGVVGASTGPVTTTPNINPTFYKNFSANHTANVKNSSGKIYSLSCHNTSLATDRFFQIHNKASAAVGGDVPQYVFQLPLASTIVIGLDFFSEKGITSGTGITFAVSDTEFTYTQPAAIEHCTQIQYE